MRKQNVQGDHYLQTLSGMTAIELLIGIAVLAIVFLIAVPGSTLVMGHYRLKTVSDDLVDSLYLARSEALSRASTVRVCPSDDGKRCVADGDWSQGWLVYSDGNGNGRVEDIELLGSFEAPQRHVRIVASGAAQNTAGFTAAGLVRENGSANGEFLICPQDFNASPRVIVVDPDGWVSLASADGRVCGTG